ncbi:O-Antigen ligase [Flavobacterium resistens]|uniref:O-Antigen ligase n=1 Tax=Flavobacterium resistens TaxID=443612 RepID=A0A521EQN4_9FLAO|nr:O-antigen ligase family protein [Flavobacterium resistens]MRX67883.1 O-antigen ligase domain-containing protein [Flavobacterium resistens]SMO86227.1 O-Antigen ligase [Flavobacterium resistens]
MKNKTITYNYLILFHLLIALAVFVLPVLSKLYAVIIPIVGIYLVNKTNNRNNEVLLVCAYLVGVEVFLRMTGGNFNNEYVKFNLVFFMFLGMIYSSFSSSSFIYWFFLILLVPCILVTASVDQINIDVKKLLFFNLSGPVCLGVCSIYMYSRRVQFSQLQNILSVMGLPILTTTVYLFLYTPSVRDVVTSTGSNFETSGGFGPNQVSTILGLGVFIFFRQLVLSSKSIKEIILNGCLLAFIGYRGVVTFSRGGIITGVVMIACLLFFLYQFSNAKGKIKFGFVLILTALMGIGVWTYSSIQTGGLIEKRYANKDALGREKKSVLSGREGIMDSEIKLFLDNPIMGVGAGMGKEFRKESGSVIASHNEITRMLAEHGMFGIFALLILFITPIVHFIYNRQHIYFFSFYLFWLLTINHAAMRIAAPAFVYALSLLSVHIMVPQKAEQSDG